MALVGRFSLNQRVIQMAIKCIDPAFLISVVRQKHPDVAEKHPTGTQHQFTFSCGLVMNVFTNGSVNFQGNSHESRTAFDIVAVIDMINRPA
ncbi:hypothetical protein OKW98_16580 [Pseudomonas sp. KU26590]|uniref:hypothetical protein n=1 Tax=Pseudomonas sp. KU26590 TaxID=2991051 RepID=UPI00223DD779|nr:hypothetical protein [Pseudomonas sp. KU26590]UZJ58218.1 hypothetical protein OKW98_16580 [Pseudomonas sp. KU26590]